jgi:hypothetical protein
MHAGRHPTPLSLECPSLKPERQNGVKLDTGWQRYFRTVKKSDKVVRHPQQVTQDQFSLVSEKVFGIYEDNFAINIELF